LTTLLVYNSASRSVEDETIAKVRAVLERAGDVDAVSPSSLETFGDEVRSAAAGADLVVSAGGDGTLHHVVNALFGRDLTFGLVPLGTGNDLARTLEIPRDDPMEAAEVAVQGATAELDIGRAKGGGVESYFVNASVGGFSVQVDEAVSDDLKKLWGPGAFWIGGIKAAASIERANVSVNGRIVKDCVAVGVGNGRTCGGGIAVWPNASPDDGLLDACAMPADNLVEAARLALKVKDGEHRTIEGVTFDRALTIEIRSDPSIELNVDGELIGLTTPATFDVAGKVRFRVPR